jgi:hypothetical protein
VQLREAGADHLAAGEPNLNQAAVVEPEKFPVSPDAENRMAQPGQRDRHWWRTMITRANHNHRDGRHYEARQRQPAEPPPAQPRGDA